MAVIVDVVVAAAVAVVVDVIVVVAAAVAGFEAVPSIGSDHLGAILLCTAEDATVLSLLTLCQKQVVSKRSWDRHQARNMTDLKGADLTPASGFSAQAW